MSRRLVAVLFLDLVGWTRLAERVDPEPLQQMLEQYYGICSGAVAEHGGEVEKFIGDAIMAVFGAVTSQEDDALRALRAALQIRAQAGRLCSPGGAGSEVEIHCGIAAGEALVTRSSHAGLRVVGDVVNLAARLQSAATAGEIVVNETVARLARRHFTMTAMEPLSLKGKADPVPAFLVTGEAPAEASDGTRMVNRFGERARLREAYREVAHDRRSKLVAVLGPPGIGKSRLVREAVGELRAAAVFGSCPSYGHNGNYVPLVQVLDALMRGSAPVNGRLGAVLAALRERGGAGPGIEEISWAARELLAGAAAKPLVVVWDGLEWAGSSLLKLIAELSESLKDLPLLTICVGRPELDPARLRGGEVIDVGALDPADSAQLATMLVAGGQDPEVQPHDLDLVDRVTMYSAGNPLFIQLMLESAAPGRPLEEVPPTIAAMVGAMIDRLPDPSREVLGAASVIGTTFALEHLALLIEPDGVDVLVERQLVRPTVRDGEYCFVQQPVHEVAYGRLEKQQRLRWHRRLAESEVSRAFHSEAAVKLLKDLRPDDEELPRLASYAAAALLEEGTAALRQRDVTTAIGLLGRSLNLVPDEAVAAIRLSDALLLSGETQRAIEVVAGVEAGACLAQRQLLAVRVGQVPQDLEPDPADGLGRCRYEQVRMLLRLAEGHFGAAEEAVCAALGHARDIGDAYEEERLMAALCEVRQWSPTPMAEKLSGCLELAKRFASDRFLLVPVLAAQARSLAFLGDRDGARMALAEAGAAVEQLRLAMGRVLIAQAAGLARALEGEHAEAEWHFRCAARALDDAGHRRTALTMHVLATRERLRQNPSDGGPSAVDRSGGGLSAEDRSGDALSGDGDIRALLERRGEMDVRGRLLCLSALAEPSSSGEILSLLDETDDPCLRGEVYFDLARAYRRRGDEAGAQAMADASVACYTAVGALRPMWTVQAWR